MFKKIRYLLEAPFVAFGLFFFRCFDVQKSSDIASKIAKFIGKKIAVNQLAFNNLSSAMPYLSKEQKDSILNEMWDNLGRVVGEFPHICKMHPSDISKFCFFDQESQGRIEQIHALKSGAIMFSAHFSNWEVGPKLLMNLGFKVNVVYRPLNNQLVEKMTAKLRGVTMIEKSASGNRKIIEALKRKEIVLIMADQRAGDGVPIQFFHAKAITTTSIARLAVKHKIPIIPACAIRIDKSFKFIAQIEKFIDPFGDDFKNLDAHQLVLAITLKVNQQLESWISEHPEQWFWVHNRWKY